MNENFLQRAATEYRRVERKIQQKNTPKGDYLGLYQRWKHPVLTREYVPVEWRFDLNERTNPFFIETMGVNAVFNTGALYRDGKFYLVARVEGIDRKSFFAVAESTSGVDGFHFWDYPIQLPDMYPEETNVYDMRLTQHEDGWIYGVFCSESKDAASSDLSAAVAQAGIVRTKDLKSWERLPNLITPSPQQRNVVLHPELIDGQYAFYTRPQDDFINAGSGGGIGFGLCRDILHPRIEKETLVDARQYHTICECKNGAGAVPIRTEKGWIHIAHGVRNTAAGLRYVIYLFVTDLKEPWRVIAKPAGYLIAPLAEERCGDVDNVVFTNGAAVLPDGSVYIYYGAADTRIHVATTTVEKLLYYAFHAPADPLRSADCVSQRCSLIAANKRLLEDQKSGELDWREVAFPQVLVNNPY